MTPRKAPSQSPAPIAPDALADFLTYVRDRRTEAHNAYERLQHTMAVKDRELRAFMDKQERELRRRREEHDASTSELTAEAATQRDLIERCDVLLTGERPRQAPALTERTPEAHE